MAKTGSGKTLGFLLPAFHLTGGASCTGGPRVLVLAPTRELAVQINAECDKFGGYFGCTSTCIYGGAPIGAQQSILRQQQPTVVVATCGRLCDLMTRSSLSLGEASYVVLDEADRMLDMGFEPQIKQIFEALPTKRQTLFFTATWPKVNTAAALCQRARAHGLSHCAASHKQVPCTLPNAVNSQARCEISAAGREAYEARLCWNFCRCGARGKYGSEPDVHSGQGKCSAQSLALYSFQGVLAALSIRDVAAPQDDVKDDKLWELLENLKEGSRVVVFANTKRRVDVCQKNFADFGSVRAAHCLIALFLAAPYMPRLAEYE